MKVLENNMNNIYRDKNIQKYNPGKQYKENQNSLSYKLREIKENQNKSQMNNSNASSSINNSNINILSNNQLTYQSKDLKNKMIPKTSINNMLNNINNQNNISNNSISNASNTNRKNSKVKNSSSTAQIDEQYEMQKLLELEFRYSLRTPRRGAAATVRRWLSYLSCRYLLFILSAMLSWSFNCCTFSSVLG